MTLPSRHRIWNLGHGGLRPSTLPLGHGGSPQYWIFTSKRERNILFLWNLEARVGFENSLFYLNLYFRLQHTRRRRFSCWRNCLFYRMWLLLLLQLSPLLPPPPQMVVAPLLSLDGEDHNVLIVQQVRNIDSMLVKCWASVEDDGPTFNQLWVDVFC